MIFFSLLTIIIGSLSLLCSILPSTALDNAGAYLSTDTELEFLITNKSEIWRVKLNDEKIRYKTNVTAIGDVDYHWTRNLLFWLDAEKHEVHSQPLDDINAVSPIVTFKQDNWEPVALAVDFIDDKVYVVDVKGLKIDLFELDGRYHSILIGTDLVRPLDIKLDPYDRLIFILDGFRIIRANMDGREPVVIVRRNINTTHGISVDVVGKKIHWVHGNHSKIVVSNYQGDEVGSYEVNSTTPMWSRFSVHNESVYWAGEFINYKADRCGDKLVRTFTPLGTSVRTKSIYESNPVPAIKALRPSVHNITFNSCKINNGGCQHMCIFVSNNSRSDDLPKQCICNIGWRLDEDSQNCTEVGDFLMYTQPGIIKSHLMENYASSNEPYLPIAEARSKFADFDYHRGDGYVYYIMKGSNRIDIIYRVNPKQHKPEVFLENTGDSYQSLAVDWLANNLYYTDALAGTINVIRTPKNKTKILSLLKNLHQPEDINVHPSRGLIFFLQTSKTTGTTLLSRAFTDGTNLTIHATAQLRKRCGFALDHDEQRIYWYEWRRGQIHHTNLDFANERVVQSQFTKFVYTIAIHDKWLYVATTNSEGVYRVDKMTGLQAEFVLSDWSNRIVKVKAFSTDVQKLEEYHPCSVDNNRGCAEFCFGVQSKENGSSVVGVCAGGGV